MAVEFHNSLIIAELFFPSATHLTSKTYIPTCLDSCCAEVGSIICFALVWLLGSAVLTLPVTCQLSSLISRGGITLYNVL